MSHFCSVINVMAAIVGQVPGEADSKMEVCRGDYSGLALRINILDRVGQRENLCGHSKDFSSELWNSFID